MNLFFSYLFPNERESINNTYKKLWDAVAVDLQLREILEYLIESEILQNELFEEMKYFYPQKEILEHRQSILTDMLKNLELVQYFEDFRDKCTQLRDIYNLEMFEKYPHTVVVKDFLVTECFIELYDQTVKHIKTLPRGNYGKVINNIFDKILDEKRVEEIDKALADVSKIRSELERISPVRINRLFSRGENIENSITTKTKGENLMERLADLADRLQISPLEKKVQTENLFPPSEGIFKTYMKIFKPIFDEVARFSKEYQGLFQTEWFCLVHETNTLLALTEMYHKLQNLGMPICSVKFIEKDKTIIMHNMYSLLLVKNGLDRTQIVCSDFSCNPDSHFNLLTGPNGGGKTIFLTAMGISQLLFQISGYTTAASAEMFPLKYLYTHFPVEERNDSQGRLVEEQSRCERMMREIEDGSMVLLNETFSSTKADIAHDLSTDILKKLLAKDSFGLFVTHFHSVKEFCKEYSEQNERKICLLVAAVDDSVEGRRLYKIVPMENASSSYSRDILLRHRMTKEQLLERCNVMKGVEA
ncbi:MAG: hypothetical protein DBX47_02415 [Clostridiales bacterium]|nr:MAG: hypothetical protein DBX47_02415 [Clostridiales bacterium]